MRPENKISPFGRNDKVGLSRVHQLFGDELNTLIEQLNKSLAARPRPALSFLSKRGALTQPETTARQAALQGFTRLYKAVIPTKGRNPDAT